MQFLAELFKARAETGERLLPAKDAAKLNRTAGGHGLAGDGYAHRPHASGVFHALGLGQSLHRFEDALVVPAG